MESFEVFLSLSSMEYLKSVKPSQRKVVGIFIDSLQNDPFQEGDHSEFDSVGRKIEIKIIGPFAVTYWADSPVKEVKVTDIRRAE